MKGLSICTIAIIVSVVGVSGHSRHRHGGDDDDKDDVCIAPHVGEWSDWGPCSETCGPDVGFQIRTKTHYEAQWCDNSAVPCYVKPTFSGVMCERGNVALPVWLKSADLSGLNVVECKEACLANDDCRAYGFSDLRASDASDLCSHYTFQSTESIAFADLLEAVHNDSGGIFVSESVTIRLEEPDTECPDYYTQP